MDCYANQKFPEFRRAPAMMPLDHFGHCPTPYPTSANIQPRRLDPSNPCTALTGLRPTPAGCPGSVTGAIENYPIGIGYVPWQQWRQTYPLDQGFQRGTIFPELDLSFSMGRCR